MKLSTNLIAESYASSSISRLHSDLKSFVAQNGRRLMADNGAEATGRDTWKVIEDLSNFAENGDGLINTYERNGEELEIIDLDEFVGASYTLRTGEGEIRDLAHAVEKANNVHSEWAESTHDKVINIKDEPNHTMYQFKDLNGDDTITEDEFIRLVNDKGITRYERADNGTRAYHDFDKDGTVDLITQTPNNGEGTYVLEDTTSDIDASVTLKSKMVTPDVESEIIEAPEEVIPSAKPTEIMELEPITFEEIMAMENINVPVAQAPKRPIEELNTMANETAAVNPTTGVEGTTVTTFEPTGITENTTTSALNPDNADQTPNGDEEVQMIGDVMQTQSTPTQIQDEIVPNFQELGNEEWNPLGNDTEMQGDVITHASDSGALKAFVVLVNLIPAIFVIAILVTIFKDKKSFLGFENHKFAAFAGGLTLAMGQISFASAADATFNGTGASEVAAIVFGVLAVCLLLGTVFLRLDMRKMCAGK